MQRTQVFLHLGAAAAVVAYAALAIAALPAPTPEQQQAAAAKKAQAAAQAEKEKQELTQSMDKVTQYWRTRASENGWNTHPQVSVAAPTKAVDAPAAQSSSSGQPGGRLGEAAANAPIRSEKAGTAPPSEDVKKEPDKPKQ